MKKTCINCKYIDIDYFNEYPCCECNNESRWERLVTELEKIKSKINLEDVDCQYEEDYAYSGGLQKAIEIIDEEISELKGE